MLEGAINATFGCRAYAIAEAGGGTVTIGFELTGARPGGGFISLYGRRAPAVGSYAFGEGMYSPSYDGLVDMGFGLHGVETYYATSPLEAGSVRLQIEDVASSNDVYYRIAGSVEATLLADPVNQVGRVIRLRATFGLGEAHVAASSESTTVRPQR